jgi:glycosyltransferase involved in cell wall biosynthesis
VAPEASGAAAPVVDVMIPAYGDGGLLREAVASVLAQDSPDWRLTVIDDRAGDDGLGEYLAGLGDARVRYLRNPVNLGINRNFQRCLEEAEHDLVVVMGSDDRLLAGYVRTVAAAAAAHPHVAWLHPGVRVIDGAGRPSLPLADRVKGWVSIRPRGGPRETGGEELATSLLRGNWMYFPSVAFRREVALRHGFREGYDVVLDLDLYLRMLLDGERVLLLPRVCFEYRRHAASLSSSEAVTGDRFDEELAYFGQARRDVAAAGWRRASRAAGLHLTSRLHAGVGLAKVLRPGAARTGPLVRRLAGHAFGRTPAAPPDAPAGAPGRPVAQAGR